MEALTLTNIPLDFAALWKLTSQDLEKQTQLGEILANLRAADKILSAGRGFIAKRKAAPTDTTDLVDYSLLTAEERGK